MKLSLLLVVACLGVASAIHSVEQVAEIKAKLAAMAQAPETNYGCSVEENLEAFKKLIGTETQNWSDGVCTRDQYDMLINFEGGETGTGASIFSVPIKFALQNPTHDESSTVSASSYVFSYGPVPARVEAGFYIDVPSTSTTPRSEWFGNVHDDFLCANLILRTLYDLDHGHIGADEFKSCEGRDPVVEFTAADLSVKAHVKWMADCGGLHDAPQTTCLKTLLFCQDQLCIDEMFGWADIGHGMKSRNRACTCTVTQLENIAPPKPIPATCDTMPVPEGWLRCDDDAADCNCPVGWDDPECASTGYGNGKSCRCTCYDRHRECIEGEEGAEAINCLDTVCTMNDIDTCMIMIPVWCDSATCPPGWRMKKGAGDIQCAGVSIADGGMGHTECEMSIGKGEVNMFAAHGRTDTSTCCDELAKCKNGITGDLFNEGGARYRKAFAKQDGKDAGKYVKAHCRSHNYNGAVYEPLEPTVDTTGDGEFDSIYCGGINQTACTTDICCSKSQCKPVEHCVGLLGCMAPEQESSCSKCDVGYFGGNCIACPAIEYSAPGAKFSCSKLKDITMYEGHCVEGYYHKAGGSSGPDKCLQCPHVDKCMLNFVSCGSATTSVCAKCKGGWTGDQCQHEPVFEDPDINVCSGHGEVDDPYKAGRSTCVGGGCEGERWMAQGVQVGPQERWVTGECTYYPAGKMRAMEALIVEGQRDDVNTDGDDWVPSNADYAGPANDHIDRDGNAFTKRRRLAAETMAEAAAKSVLQARAAAMQGLVTTTPAPVITDETIQENAKALEAADEAIRAEDANEHEVARETQAADAKRAELVKEKAIAAEQQQEAASKAAELMRIKLLEAESQKPREGVCMCGGPNDVWESLSGVGTFEDATCNTYFQGELTAVLCTDPDVECGSCEGICRSTPPTAPCECDSGYEGDLCEGSASCTAITNDDLTFPALVHNCPDAASQGALCELTCDPHYYLVSKADGICYADHEENTATYKGYNVNCRLCTKIEHCLGHETERRLATGVKPHPRRLAAMEGGEKGEVTCSTAEDSVCTVCAPGYYGKTCVACELGRFMPDGSKHCEDCAAGQFTSVSGSTDCRGCLPGEFIEAGACVKCLEGTFSAEDNSAGCTDCEAQTIAAEQGMSECAACEAGTYQKNEGRSKCHDCTPIESCTGDISCTNNRNTVCTSCGSGFYPSKDGKKCKECYPAEHCMPGFTECTQAGEHETGNDRDRSTCTQCIQGFHVDEDGICLKCPILPNCVKDMEVCSALVGTGNGAVAFATKETVNGNVPPSTCMECKPGFKGDTCEESAIDTECFDQEFKYADDGSGCIPGDGGGVNCDGAPPLNDGSTHPPKEHTFFGCQLECRKDKACELFSYDTATHDCLLHSLDAGCTEEGCPEQALTFVNERGDNGNLVPAPGWIAGPKTCQLATCDSMVCPEGWWLDMEFIYQNKKGGTRSAIKCQREECTIEHDLHRCCLPAVCGEYTCPEDYIKKEGVETTTCSDREGKMRDEVVMSVSGDDALGQFAPACTGDDDLALCCDERAKCDTFAPPSGFTHKRDGLHVSKKNCLGSVCTEENDLMTCCDGLATCESFKCPVNSKAVDANTGEVRNIDFLSRPEPHTIFCNGMECDDSWDRDTCCAQRAECVDMECPAEYVHSEWAIRTQIACKGIECTVEDDLQRCCHKIVYCDTMISTGEGHVCPEGYSPKFDLTSIPCDSGSGRCDVRIDRDTCCDRQEECLEMDPEFFACHLVNNEQGPDCDGRCVREQCEAHRADGCAWGVGPPEMPWNEYIPEGNPEYPSLDEFDQPIGIGACGYAECHRRWVGCVCPHAEDQWGDDEILEGAFFPSDLHEFVITGMGWHGAVDKFSGECRDSFVEHGLLQGEISMKLSGDGNSEPCSEGFTAKLDPLDTFCHGPWCTLEHDFDTCCVKQASCDTLMSTLEGYALKPQPYEILCAGEICDPVVDRDTCCDAQGSCADMACPAGMMQKNGTHLCNGGACDPLVDANVCCDMCPPGKFAATDGSDCVDCESGKYSGNGYAGEGSIGCLDCRSGKYSDPGMDHCLDCSPIFACSSKKGMFLDAQPTEPPEADFMMMPFNTAGCANTGGDLDTEAQCQAACEYLGMEYATDGSNIQESGPSHCFSQQGSFCKFAKTVDAAKAIDTFAPLCVGGGDADGFTGHGEADIDAFKGNNKGYTKTEGDKILETHDEDRAAAMMAGVEAELEEEALEVAPERRRLRAQFAAVMAIAGSDNVQCGGSGDSICTACHIGYYGSGTSECLKCEKMENCEYGCGHEHGVSCDGASGEHIPEECGDCKEGFFEPYCTGCTVIDGCMEDAMSCTTASDTKCGKCSPGYFPDGTNGEMDVCSQCVEIPHCYKAFCTNGEDHICLECEFGFYPAGAECADIKFEKNSIMTYEIGHDAFASSITAEEEYFEYDMVCKRSFLKEFNQEFDYFKADMAKMAEAGDTMLPDQRNKMMQKMAFHCEHHGCVAETSELAGEFVFSGCYSPQELQKTGILKML